MSTTQLRGQYNAMQLAQSALASSIREYAMSSCVSRPLGVSARPSLRPSSRSTPSVSVLASTRRDVLMYGSVAGLALPAAAAVSPQSIYDFTVRSRKQTALSSLRAVPLVSPVPHQLFLLALLLGLRLFKTSTLTRLKM